MTDEKQPITEIQAAKAFLGILTETVDALWKDLAPAIRAKHAVVMDNEDVAKTELLTALMALEGESLRRLIPDHAESILFQVRTLLPEGDDDAFDRRIKVYTEAVHAALRSPSASGKPRPLEAVARQLLKSWNPAQKGKAAGDEAVSYLGRVLAQLIGFWKRFDQSYDVVEENQP